MTAANEIREHLGVLRMSQREAARELDIREREFRGYCMGDDCPLVVLLALRYMVERQRASAKTRGYVTP